MDSSQILLEKDNENDAIKFILMTLLLPRRTLIEKCNFICDWSNIKCLFSDLYVRFVFPFTTNRLIRTISYFILNMYTCIHEPDWFRRKLFEIYSENEYFTGTQCSGHLWTGIIFFSQWRENILENNLPPT